ncbi:hypothetical protein [Paenibacillus elgii]|uniref:hypothetical protein n=1 Tax=Paenibacillus elgii TaxID=189691 RepID=UPI0026C069C1|nr:hypothetical protein [Paenibacillus elgii]
MRWSEVCTRYPSCFVLVEALKAVSNKRKRTIEEMTVVEEYDNPMKAWDGYKRHHMENPEREFYVFHTSKQEIEVIEGYLEWSTIYSGAGARDCEECLSRMRRYQQAPRNPWGLVTRLILRNVKGKA